ncbi:MAG TPA: thioredoxin domain-containing protein [Candidatus Angelobacter sp.]
MPRWFGEAATSSRSQLIARLLVIPFLAVLLASSLCAAQEPSSHAVINTQSGTTFAQGPANAAVTIVEFSDFECPFSGKAAPEIKHLLEANPQKIRLIFKHNPLPFHSHSSLAHEAAMAAGDQGKFWEMHDLLFVHQGQLGEADLLQYARQLKLDLAVFQHALESHAYKHMVAENLEEGRALGVGGTPTFFINGKKLVGAQSAQVFQAAIDEALGLPARVVPVPAPETDAIERVEIGNAPIRGPTAAPVTIIEFSDFQCPFCAEAVPNMQELARQYPQGIRWVFKNFPLEFHTDSLLAHKAALAAGEQGKFWEMHDLIFANQGAIKRDDLIQKASQLGLEVKKFIADLDGNKFQSILESDKAEGARLGVTGTPTFFINGKRKIGAWPLDAYKQLVEAELNSGGQNRVTAATTALSAVKPANEAIRPAPARPAKHSFSTKGPENAPVTLTWYGDLESPLSSQAAQVVAQLLATYPEKIRLTFKNLPMEFHVHAAMAHQAMLAAGAQGKFWQMQQLILTNQNKMTRDDLIAEAKTLGLNQSKFTSAIDGQLYQTVLDEDAGEARRQGVYGVPVFFINEKRIDGVQPLATFKQVIEAELAKTQTVMSGQ